MLNYKLTLKFRSKIKQSFVTHDIIIIIIIMEDFIVKVLSWIKYNAEGLPA